MSSERSGLGILGDLLDRAFGRPRGWLGWVGGKVMGGGNKGKLVQTVLDFLDVGPGDSVLEVGFGPGVGIYLAAERVGESGFVAGVDPSDVMLQMARRRNAEAIARGKVKLLLGTAERLPFGERVFDKVFAMNSVQVWTDPLAGLQEIHRVLKDDGRLVLSFNGPGRKGLTSDAVVASVEAAGFRRAWARAVASTLYVIGEC